jgi:MFS transporter, MFS domain-containing protein family, molybdate-anion transporter
MGRATLVNGFVASAAGVASNKLVSMSGVFTAPFVASGLLLVLAWTVIRGTWGENYGGSTGSENVGVFQAQRLRQTWAIIRNGQQIILCHTTKHPLIYL